jgi:hypothetical protein
MEHAKQRLNRVNHAKKAYNIAQKKANALKRQYHKAVFLALYGQNQPHRNSLMQHEIAALRNVIRTAKRNLMANRVLSKTILPPNMTRLIMSKVG